MKTIATKILNIDELSVGERTARTALGATLIGSVFFAGENTLGSLALLPLLGIYPLFSGLTGSAPVRSLFGSHSAAYSLTYAALSIALIGSVLIGGAAPLGTAVVLPLLGSYAALCALLGRSPLSALIEANKSIPYVVPPIAETSAGPQQMKVANAA